MESGARLEILDFHDIPRSIVASLDGRAVLLDCPFDDDTDEYPDRFAVYVMPTGWVPPSPGATWVDIERAAVGLAGHVPVAEVDFDESRRRSLRVPQRVFDLVRGFAPTRERQ